MAEQLAGMAPQDDTFGDRLRGYAGLVWRHKWSFLGIYILGTLAIAGVTIGFSSLLMTIPRPSVSVDRQTFLQFWLLLQRVPVRFIAYCYLSGFLAFLLLAGSAEKVSVWKACRRILGRWGLLLLTSFFVIGLYWVWLRASMLFGVGDGLGSMVFFLPYILITMMLQILLAFAVIEKTPLMSLPALTWSVFSGRWLRIVAILCVVAIGLTLLEAGIDALKFFESPLQIGILLFVAGIIQDIIAIPVKVAVMAACVGYLPIAKSWQESGVREEFE